MSWVSHLWTPWADATLRYWHKNGKSWKVIAHKMRRSYQTVRLRAIKLGIYQARVRGKRKGRNKPAA